LTIPPWNIFSDYVNQNGHPPLYCISAKQIVNNYYQLAVIKMDLRGSIIRGYRIFISVLVILSVLLSGCAPDQANTRRGVGIGVLTGCIAGNQVKGGDKKKNILIGCLAGALVGGALGSYLDKKERALREAYREDQAKIERPAKNQLLISFSESVPFASGSSSLRPSA
jgi:predicted small secreted protein